jgi:hypothetical protein
VLVEQARAEGTPARGANSEERPADEDDGGEDEDRDEDALGVG